MQKKFILILIFGYALPYGLSLVSSFLRNRGEVVYVGDFVSLNLVLIIISIFSLLYLLYLNYKSHVSNKVWNGLIILLLLWTLFDLYASYSISNFGF